MKNNLKNNKLLLISIIFEIIGIVSLIVFLPLSLKSIVSRHNFSYILSVVYLAVVWVPLLISVIFKFKVNTFVAIFYEVFIVLAILVGSVWSAYNFEICFDKFVHGLSGVIFALFFYNVFIVFNKDYKKLFWIFVFVFSFAMMTGGVWEIFEFTSDSIFGENAQRWADFEGRMVLMDTMTDLVSDFVGSVIGAVIALFLKKNELKKAEETKAEGEKEDNLANKKLQSK